MLPVFACIPLGVAELLELTCELCRSERAPQLVRQSNPELYQLVCPLSGRRRAERAHARAGAGEPREMVLFDSSLPPPAVPGALVLRFPKRSLRLAPQRVTQLLAVPFPARTGCGRLLSQLLTGIADEYAHCSPPELIQLGQTALDLTTVILGRRAYQDPELPSESRRRILYLRIATFVDRYLGDPALSPAAIAAAHGISLRYVQRIFQEHGTTAAAFIREQRLARCRRDFADPALRDVPVHAIGARWGFPRASDFNRAFKTTVGMSPGRFRESAGR
ncbi:helix-turn-helix domain-containing protein [Streptomyces sp. NPDC020898]|uniref:helix-turn-helix domain-containing protein n=1 Tax=Streptomyces sp. NPDC020898 TaxID=3365101 RepID=UPI0037A9F40F